MTEKINLKNINSGVIRDSFSDHELDVVADLMSKLKSHDPEENPNRFKPIGIGHMLYSWFEKKIFNKVVLVLI